MTMSEDDKLIDDMLAEAKEASVDLPEGLLARVLEDAAAVTADRTPEAVPASGPLRQGWLSWFGGWPGLAGLSTAAAAGVFIGFAAPQGVNSVAAVVDPTPTLINQIEPVGLSLAEFDEWSLEDG